MDRLFSEFLKRWKNHPLRTPLIVRGARQVGKTYVVEAFGRQEFGNTVTINFETAPNYCLCFDELEPSLIVRQIELIRKEKVIPGSTLLFLDEIQQCPKALQALRYFKEKLPELHVVAAGSLLDFAIRDEEFSFPVGRVQFARLYPLSFEEFLNASGDTALTEALRAFDCSSPPPGAVHQYLLDRTKEYFSVGGMPASVSTFLTTQSLLDVRYVQKALWDAFESDFSKYAKGHQHRHLRRIFSQVPRLIGDHVKYSRIDPELPNPARDIKQAIELLRLAGLLHPILASSAGGLPLLSGLKEAVFKLVFLDIGMVEQAMNVDPRYSDLMAGPLAEQFVGQELLAASDPLLGERLFFWARDGGTAEVDYLIAHEGMIYPVEVKAGKSGKLKSLYLFLGEKRSAFGIKISPEALNWDPQRKVLSVPLYLTAHLPRLISGIRLT